MYFLGLFHLAVSSYDSQERFQRDEKIFQVSLLFYHPIDEYLFQGVLYSSDQVKLEKYRYIDHWGPRVKHYLHEINKQPLVYYIAPLKKGDIYLR